MCIRDSSLNNIPQVERELLSIERLQSISENIYIFLLKKRAEAKITSSSNVSDSKVLEPAIYNVKNPVFPNKNKNYLFAIILGFLLLCIAIRLDLILKELLSLLVTISYKEGEAKPLSS